jgi:hypothetical protein
MQNWEKIGLLYHNPPLAHTHAALPIALQESENVYRIFFSSRNSLNQSLPFSLSIDLQTLRIIDSDNRPLLFPGLPGEFDAHGIMPTCMIKKDDGLYMFYIGWNLATDVPFRNALGVAVSQDKGKTFSKLFRGPVMDRSIHDPCFVASCDILKDGNQFRMWYLSGLKWEKHRDHWRHYYHIKSATSQDLVHWHRNGDVAIDFKHASEYAISTPRVIKDKTGLYRMWYSYRGSPASETYRIGYAESDDGNAWTRKDESIILPVSNDGWDSQMLCYPFLFAHRNNLYMLYNGNDYGKTGFGIAVLKS